MESGKTRWNGYTSHFLDQILLTQFKTSVSVFHVPTKFKTLRFEAQSCALFNDKEY